MNRALCSIGILLLAGAGAYAQDGATKAEVGLNYSFVNRNNEQFTNSFHQNGGSGYIEYNLNRTVGLVADLGGYTGDFNRQTFTYLFGPRLNLRTARFVPYVQFLFGGANEWGVVRGTNVSTTQNGFAYAAGGGLDVNVTRHFAVKPFQLEYLSTQIPQLGSNLNSVQNNLRYSAGIVYRFGAR